LVLDVDYRIIEYKNNINAGTASVIIEGINNYVGTLEITFVIEKATLTVTADDTERQFKMGNPPLTETVEGFQGTDTGSLIIGTFLLETTADASSPAGGYVISVEKGTADAGNNYKFVFVNGTLTVTPMDIGTPDEIMATVNGTFTYTGLPHKPSVTVTDDWKIRTLLTQGKDYELSYSNNTNAGTATVTITGIGNYAGTLTVNFTINKAVLIVTADDKRKAPGADDPKFTATAKGFVNNENSSVIKGQFLIWRDGDDPTLGEAPDENGIYSRFTIWISTGTASADNYEFKFMNGTLTIRDKDSLIPTWMPIAAVAAVVLILLFMLTGVRFRETGSVTHNGRGLAGVVIEYTMNGESGTAVTDRNGQYLIRALAGSEVTIMNAEKKGYELSGTLPEPFIMEKATNVDLTMEKV
jgi:hypothetical protein